MTLSSSQSRLLLVAMVCGSFASGCGSDQPDAQQDGHALTATPTAGATLNTTQPKPSEQESKEAEVQEVAEFVPPFPNRTDPFAQPTANKAAAVVRQRREENGTDLQLKGFVHVDRPKAMLRIDGQLWIAGAGESRNGVQIASIAPPVVTFRRDEQDFELSLMNDN